MFCKFAAYFQNTFSQEHHWVAASVVFLDTSLKRSNWKSTHLNNTYTTILTTKQVARNV